MTLVPSALIITSSQARFHHQLTANINPWPSSNPPAMKKQKETRVEKTEEKTTGQASLLQFQAAPALSAASPSRQAVFCLSSSTPCFH
jgi:hypothetical protein